MDLPLPDAPADEVALSHRDLQTSTASSLSRHSCTPALARSYRVHPSPLYHQLANLLMSTAKPNPDPTNIACVTVLGEHIAKPFRTQIQEATAQLNPKPKLVGILANSGAPSRAYANWTAKACEAVGIDYELREVGIVADGASEGTAEQGEVEEAILAANEDDNVNGIMVYYPIFGPRQDGYLQQAVSPLKDVEGLNFAWCVAWGWEKGRRKRS